MKRTFYVHPSILFSNKYLPWIPTCKTGQPNSFGYESKGPVGSDRLSYTSNDAAKMERVSQEDLSNDCNYPDQSMDSLPCIQAVSNDQLQKAIYLTACSLHPIPLR